MKKSTPSIVLQVLLFFGVTVLSLTAVVQNKPANKAGSSQQAVDIYIGGHILDENKAAYMKNGILVIVGQKESVINAMAVADNHVYAAGEGHGQAVYWKDGQEVALTTAPNNGAAFAITVFKNDVYVAGYERVDKTRPGNYKAWEDEARLWKNGQPVPLVISKGLRSGLSNMAVDPLSGTVYTSGMDNSGTRYWINGELKTLADNGKPVDPVNMQILNNTLYVIGTNAYSIPGAPDRIDAAYWSSAKGTVILTSAQPLSASKASGIAVTGNDIYIAGYTNGKIVYWKNGVATALGDAPDFPDNRYWIALAGTNIYVMGRDKTGPKLWINGQASAINGMRANQMIIVNKR